VTFDDDQILWTVPDQTTGGLLQRPKEPYRDPVSGNRHYLFATRDGDRYIPVSMMIVEHVVINNAKDGWKRPIFFSSGTSDKSRLGLEKRTRMVGQAFEVLPTERNMDFDFPATAGLLDSVFLYRGYDNPDVGLDDNTVGLSLAFPERMIAVSDYYRRLGDTAQWTYWIRKAQRTFPAYHRSQEQAAAQQRVTGDSVAAEQTLQRGVDVIKRYVDEMPDNRLYWYFLGKMQEDAGRYAEAEQSLAHAFWMNPNDGTTYNDYVGFLAEHGKTAEAARAAARWITYYPNDQRARTLAGAARR
jgi:tetratricopeptide (TPR) repeat protein